MVTRGFKYPVAEANRLIDTVFVADAAVMHVYQDVIFGDIRETIELHQSGSVLAVLYAPRGLLKFMVDPEGSLHKPELVGSAQLLMFCALGGRSALVGKTIVDTGVENVPHIAVGFAAWQEASGFIES